MRKRGIHFKFRNKGLSELNPAQQMQFEMMMKEKHIAEGQLLWKETEEAYFVCLLYRGSMKLTNTITKEQVMIKEGMFVGDVEAILLDTVHITQLEVLQTSLVFQIDKVDLISYLKRNPGFFITYGQSKYFA